MKLRYSIILPLLILTSFTPTFSASEEGVRHQKKRYNSYNQYVDIVRDRNFAWAQGPLERMWEREVGEELREYLAELYDSIDWEVLDGIDAKRYKQRLCYVQLEQVFFLVQILLQVAIYIDHLAGKKIGLKLLLSLGDKGFSRAYYALGVVHMRGLAITYDPEKAHMWWLRAWENRDCPEVCLAIGSTYLDWFEMGDEAPYDLLVHNGDTGTVPMPLEHEMAGRKLALEWIEAGLRQIEESEAADGFESPSVERFCKEQLRPALVQRLGRGHLDIGCTYRDGKRGCVRSKVFAKNHLQKAHTLGEPLAAKEMGEYYTRELYALEVQVGLVRDESVDISNEFVFNTLPRAIRDSHPNKDNFYVLYDLLTQWYERAAQTGDEVAIMGLASLYLQGAYYDREACEFIKSHESAMEALWPLIEKNHPVSCLRYAKYCYERPLKNMDFRSSITYLLRAVHYGENEVPTLRNTILNLQDNYVAAVTNFELLARARATGSVAMLEYVGVFCMVANELFWVLDDLIIPDVPEELVLSFTSKVLAQLNKLGRHLQRESRAGFRGENKKAERAAKKGKETYHSQLGRTFELALNKLGPVLEAIHKRSTAS